MTYEQLLETDEIRLRALEPDDVDLLYVWENDTNVWSVSSTLAPFSKQMLRDYVESAQNDIYAAKQLRLMIDDKSTGKTIGTIDLFDFDAHNRRAGIGIFVVEEFQKQHYATKALQILLHYCETMLLLRQVYVDVPCDNVASVTLFSNAGFQQIGIKKDWLLNNSGYSDVVGMQKIFCGD